MDFDYLESWQQRAGAENRAYSMSPELLKWIETELLLRLEVVRLAHPDKPVEVFLTLRTFKKQPLFVLGYREDESTSLLEAWCFRMVPPAEQGHPGVQLVLDRAPLKEIFG